MRSAVRAATSGKGLIGDALDDPGFAVSASSWGPEHLGRFQVVILEDLPHGCYFQNSILE